METTNNNYGYTEDFFKPGDIVLVRDNPDERWRKDEFISYSVKNTFPYDCVHRSWRECILYEMNEYLLDTTDSPEIYGTSMDTVCGVKLKPGYVLEFFNNVGVIFPTEKGLAMCYVTGWCFIDKVKIKEIRSIRGRSKHGRWLAGGDILWKKPENIKITEAQIAEKFGLSNVQGFEIVKE